MTGCPFQNTYPGYGNKRSRDYKTHSQKQNFSDLEKKSQNMAVSGYVIL